MNLPAPSNPSSPRRLGRLCVLIVASFWLLAPLTVRAEPTELFFSEYVEGSSNNKVLEIFNGTGGTVDLDAEGYRIEMFFNGNPMAETAIDLDGSVASGEVYVVADEDASSAIAADQESGSPFFRTTASLPLKNGEPDS